MDHALDLIRNQQQLNSPSKAHQFCPKATADGDN